MKTLARQTDFEVAEFKDLESFQKGEFIRKYFRSRSLKRILSLLVFSPSNFLGLCDRCHRKSTLESGN